MDRGILCGLRLGGLDCSGMKRMRAWRGHQRPGAVTQAKPRLSGLAVAKPEEAEKAVAVKHKTLAGERKPGLWIRAWVLVCVWVPEESTNALLDSQNDWENGVSWWGVVSLGSAVT